jgi:hypothetical protein
MHALAYVKTLSLGVLSLRAFCHKRGDERCLGGSLQLDSNDSEYTVKCSFLELYNEESSDLLAVGDARDQKLRMLEDKSGVVVQVQYWGPHCKRLGFLRVLSRGIFASKESAGSSQGRDADCRALRRWW